MVLVEPIVWITSQTRRISLSSPGLEECIPAHHTVQQKLHGDACSEKSSLSPPPARSGVRRVRAASTWQHKPQNSCKLIQLKQIKQVYIVSHTATTFAPSPGRPGPTQPLLPTGPVLDAHTGLVHPVLGKLRQPAAIHFAE